MKGRIAEFLTETAVVAGLAMGLAIGGGHLAAQETESDNYFDTQSVPAGVRWGQDPSDVYAPVDFGISIGDSLRVTGTVLAGDPADDAALDPCSPQRCKAW